MSSRLRLGEEIMKLYGFRLALAVVLILVASARPLSAQEQKGKFIIFDVSGASTSPFLGTQAFANNNSGAVVGFYTDVNLVPHAFLRTPKGVIISFDAPGADLTQGADHGTVAYSINDCGDIDGQLQDENGLFHGFIRYRDGSFTTFLPPCEGCGNNQGAGGTANINSKGEAAGFYFDAESNSHGFIRNRDAKINTFDVPGGTGTTFVCLESCLNSSGETTGWYSDTNGTHGFVRDGDGNFATFDAPDSAAAPNMFTLGGSINDEGTVAGYYLGSDLVFHGYVRTRSGKITSFDVASVSTVVYGGTAGFSISGSGAVAGAYFDASNIMYGFERWPDGKITTFEVPQTGLVSGQGTRPSTTNASGQITGWYVDGNNLNHGFIWSPEDDSE
jgi:hypothetical protein